MRLALQEVAAIRRATVESFGPDVIVRLFGSRLGDTARGGDIDLHFEIAGGRPSAASTAAFRGRLSEMIGERAVDLVFHAPDAPLTAIDRAAHRRGVVL